MLHPYGTTIIVACLDNLSASFNCILLNTLWYRNPRRLNVVDTAIGRGPEMQKFGIKWVYCIVTTGCINSKSLKHGRNMELKCTPGQASSSVIDGKWLSSCLSRGYAVTSSNPSLMETLSAHVRWLYQRHWVFLDFYNTKWLPKCN